MLICILSLLNHKTYTQKVKYSTNPRILREHQTKKMLLSLPATRKRLDCTTQVSHLCLWIHFVKCLYPQVQQLTQLTGLFIAKTFPHCPQTIREIKVIFPREQIEFGTENLYKAVFHKVTSLLFLTHCTDGKFNSAWGEGYSVYTDWSATHLTCTLQPQITGRAMRHISMQQEQEYKAQLNSLWPCQEQPGQQQRPLAKWSSIINM